MERFAAFFGTIRFLAMSTFVIATWLFLNKFGSAVGDIVTNISHGKPADPYPHQFLNLIFSAVAYYAAPIILFAQSVQMKRDKLDAIADAKHREELAASQRVLLEENTKLTADVKALATANMKLGEAVHALLQQQVAGK
jgi:uncharacterized membrane protein